MGNKLLDKRRGYALTILGGSFWAVSGACGQYLFQYKWITSNWVVPIRLLSGGIVILIISLFQRKNRMFEVWRNKSDILHIVVFALFGTALCQYAYFTSISKSNATTATVLIYTSPVFIVLYMALKNRKLPNRTEIMAIILVALGTFLCATHGN